MRVTMALFAVALGCSATAHRTEPAPTGPVGCCCSYSRCTAGFTQPGCVSDAQFEGWTYTWHEGPCTSADRYPAPDVPPAAR